MICPSYVLTHFRLIDVFTKALEKDQFIILHNKSGRHDILSNLRESIKNIYIKNKNKKMFSQLPGIHYLSSLFIFYNTRPMTLRQNVFWLYIQATDHQNFPWR